MSIRLHDSATRQVREFSPRVPGQVGIYLCGATVQGAPHIGHLRSAIAFDVLVRWLRRSGYQVTLVRNVTDIDDKILTKSAEAGAPWWAWANRFEREFNHAYEALGVLPPTYEPRATGHIPEMIELIARLIERGHAYSTAAGNVYFDVSSWPNYGELTHQSVDQLTSAEDEASDKGDPHDFALWKAAKDTDPEGASWATPWGRGRPGWHLECSTMSRKYLGEGFDIHGGGIDLRFPHHENETAQSKAAGWPFANLWMHNAWVTVGGEKMSKSLGNSLTVDALLERTSAAVLRYALAAVHYRSTLEFSDVTVAESQAAWERIVSFVERSAEVGGAAEADQVAQAEVPREFADALNDDLNVSAGLAVIHDQLRAANTALAAGDKDEVAHAHVRIRAMLSVLGLDPLAEPWAGEHHSGSAQAKALASLVEKLLQERASARGAKDFARADALRDQLTEAGIAVEDGADGARWSVRGEN